MEKDGSGIIMKAVVVEAIARGLTLLGLFFVRGWVKGRAEGAQDLFDRIIGRLNKR